MFNLRVYECYGGPLDGGAVKIDRNETKSNLFVICADGAEHEHRKIMPWGVFQGAELAEVTTDNWHMYRIEKDNVAHYKGFYKHKTI